MTKFTRFLLSTSPMKGFLPASPLPFSGRSCHITFENTSLLFEYLSVVDFGTLRDASSYGFHLGPLLSRTLGRPISEIDSLLLNYIVMSATVIFLSSDVFPISRVAFFAAKDLKLLCRKMYFRICDSFSLK